MKLALDTSHEITKLIKSSPHRDYLLERLKQDLAPGSSGICTLCPTRWTVRAESLASILSNYAVLQELWVQSAEATSDTEVVACINGVVSKMSTFSFLFGPKLGELVLRHTDNLSKTLQHKEFSASESQDVAKLVVNTLGTLRNKDSFEFVCENLEKDQDNFEVPVDLPVLPRKRRCPARFDDGKAVGDHPSAPPTLYRQYYYEALDLTINCIKSRFEQPGCNTYQHLNSYSSKL